VTTLQIGPIQIRLHSALNLTAWLKPLRSYYGEWLLVPAGLVWDFHIHNSEFNPLEHEEESFVFQRHALYFKATASERTSHLYTQGNEADFLAGLELSMSLACEVLGGLSIHGAAGAVNGTGYLMPGISGTGKSTAARYGGFEHIIGDERVLLLPLDGGWLMTSTPFWSTGRLACPERATHKLDVILQLDQAESLALTVSKPLNSLEWLLRSVVYYGTDEDERERQLGRAIEVVEATQHFRLGFTKRGPWAWKLNQMHSSYLSTK
jgi:hypothetical protein